MKGTEAFRKWRCYPIFFIPKQKERNSAWLIALYRKWLTDYCQKMIFWMIAHQQVVHFLRRAISENRSAFLEPNVLSFFYFPHLHHFLFFSKLLLLPLLEPPLRLPLPWSRRKVENKGRIKRYILFRIKKIFVLFDNCKRIMKLQATSLHQGKVRNICTWILEKKTKERKWKSRKIET